MLEAFKLKENDEHFVKCCVCDKQISEGMKNEEFDETGLLVVDYHCKEHGIWRCAQEIEYYMNLRKQLEAMK